MNEDILVLIYANTENNINVIKKLFECYESKKTVNILGVEYIVVNYEQAIRKAGCSDAEIKFFLESLKDHGKNDIDIKRQWEKVRERIKNLQRRQSKNNL